MASESDREMLKDIQARFEVDIPAMPDKIDVATYSKCSFGLISSCFLINLVLEDEKFIFQSC